mgnify:CR=1 FL=1
MSTYKKFTAQDYAIVPFNAHKQYSFGSSSAASNRVTHYSTQWTSESISLYSSASSFYGGDSRNVIKYNQIDHLFYKDFLTNHANLFGQGFHYQNHKRNLYEKTNILSIPFGLYGDGIKPKSFYLSSSNHVIIDDGEGNLIINNDDIHLYPTDLRANVFRLDPIKGFKKYDLGLFKDYAVKLLDPQNPKAGILKAFYKKGKINPNATKTHSTHEDLFENDDSYFLNKFKYKNVNFIKTDLGDDNHKFSSMVFNGATGSKIEVPDNERFNFDTNDDFAISFNITPQTLDYDGVGIPLARKHKFQGGYIFNITDDYAYIVKPELQTTSNAIYFDDTNNVDTPTPGIGGGEDNTALLNTGEDFLGYPLSKTHSGFNGWWLSSKDELEEIISVLNPYTNKNFKGTNSAGKTVDSLNATENLLVVSDQTQDASLNYTNYQLYSGTNEVFTAGFNQTSPAVFQYLLVRKVHIKQLDNFRRDIIGKSTTKTVVPSSMMGTSEILNTSVSGNMQLMDTNAESQFPFEIYLKNRTLYFDRADTNKVLSLNYDINVAGTNSHILCQKSASRMEIYLDGELKAEIDGTLQTPTRNRANLYIGSKGALSKPDSDLINSQLRHFNGNLSNINIWENSFTSNEITKVSESINSSPYVGNIFYKTGFATITHPKYHSILGNIGVGDMAIESDFVVDPQIHTGISKLEFQGTHKIREWEYQCTVDQHEYNATTNISARKSNSSNKYELANFTTSSLFKPYITTIGLYDDNNDLLVVGKLNQPIKTSNETDTTFIIRWDT